MADPLVSIITPCYRQGDYLSQTLDSALQQTFPDIEVIVVNDGSDDNTDQVAQSYGDKIIYIRQENQGLSAARNSGIKRARGKYLHCLDSDDILHPEAIASMVEAMEDREDRLVFVGVQDFENSITDTHLNKKVFKSGLKSFPYLIHGNFGPPVGILSPLRRVRELGGFDTSLRSCEDWMMWLKVILAGAHVTAVPRVLAYYRWHAASMSKNKLRMLETRTEVLKYLHGEMLARPDMLAQFGQELLIAEYRVRRRWLTTDKHSSSILEITDMIRSLEQQGFILPRSRMRLLADRCLGLAGEKFTMEYFRWIRPSVYSDYSNGCN